MNSADMERLMALFHAQALAIAALFQSHPQPAQLSTTFAKIVAKDDSVYEMEASLLFEASIQTFRRAIPPH